MVWIIFIMRNTRDICKHGSSVHSYLSRKADVCTQDCARPRCTARWHPASHRVLRWPWWHLALPSALSSCWQCSSSVNLLWTVLYANALLPSYLLSLGVGDLLWLLHHLPLLLCQSWATQVKDWMFCSKAWDDAVFLWLKSHIWTQCYMNKPVTFLSVTNKLCKCNKKGGPIGWWLMEPRLTHDLTTCKTEPLSETAPALSCFY